MTTPREDAIAALRGEPREYRKVASVMAAPALSDGIIPTLEGDHAYSAGDYIAGPGQAGEYWPVKRSIFEATYEPVAALGAEAETPDPLPGANIYITTCLHGVDLRFTPRCYVCKPEGRWVDLASPETAKALARLIDECYQRGLDADEAAPFILAAMRETGR